MTNTALNPTTVPASPFYSQGIDVRSPTNLVFVSGQVGIASDGQVLEGIEAQARQAVANLNAVLHEAGLTDADLTKLTIYLTDPPTSNRSSVPWPAVCRTRRRRRRC